MAHDSPLTIACPSFNSAVSRTISPSASWMAASLGLFFSRALMVSGEQPIWRAATYTIPRAAFRPSAICFSEYFGMAQKPLLSLVSRLLYARLWPA